MSYSKGLMLYSDHINADKSYLSIPDGADFIIAVAMSELSSEAGFNKHVQEAYNANIPCLAMVQMYPLSFSKQFSLADPLWKDGSTDEYCIVLDKLFGYSGGTVKYAVSGIVLDARYNSEFSVSESWVAEMTQHYKGLFSTRYNLPIYVLTCEEDYNNFSSDGGLQTFLSNQTMLSSYTVATSTTLENDELIKTPSGKPIPNYNGIKFWWYGSQSFDFLSGTTSLYAPIVQYRGTKESLYSELSYEPREVEESEDAETTEESSSGEVIDTVDTEDISITVGEVSTSFEGNVISKLDSIIILLKNIYNKM